MKYILGTAQFGSSYGVNNTRGMPSENDIYSILNTAYDNDIVFLDTASSYGDSERTIGKFIEITGKHFNICSKYSGKHDPLQELNKTLKMFSTEKLYLYYLHRFSDCKNTSITNAMIRFRSKGIIEKTGISIYSPDELYYILDNCGVMFNVIQIPFSIIDCNRWVNPIKKANEKGMTIFCRSILLQGALLKKRDDKFIKKYQAEGIVDSINDLCIRYNCTKNELAFNFCNSFDEISGILFGCETLAQLEDNVDILGRSICFSKHERQHIMNQFKDIGSSFIDPRQWKTV